MIASLPDGGKIISEGTPAYGAKTSVSASHNPAPACQLFGTRES